MITISNIHKSYGNLQVLKGICLEVQAGEVVSIVGASGAGKTTLLQIIGTLDTPDSGEIRYGDTLVSSLSGDALARFRNRHIGFVFQSHNLLPEFTALENVALPALILGAGMQQARAEAMRLLQSLGLEQRANHRPAQLSGGEQQRVAVARALVNHPAVVLADEPSGNLDTSNARELHQLFFQLRDSYNQTFIIVTHNETLATMADRRIELRDGNVVGGQPQP
ncbi:MAG: ABC transporter ATP-binding protein [Bacteroidales bacterium]|nr:ABC transporter ATP-binding protein [Bacteroidales bacterium]